MTTNREQVIEKILYIATDYAHQFSNARSQASILNAKDCFVKRLLTATYPSGQPMIGILDDDQTKPENTYVTPLKQVAYMQAQQDMLEANWRKLLPFEGDGGE